MPYNNSGTFLRTFDFTSDAAAGVPISSARVDAELDDIALALSGAMARNGDYPMSGPLNLAGFDLQNLAIGLQNMPSLSFSGFPGSGLHGDILGQIGVSVGGVDKLIVTGSNVQSAVNFVAPSADFAGLVTANSQVVLTVANLNNTALTGVPTAPTAPPGTFDGRLATTSFVQTSLLAKPDTATVTAALALKANLSSPIFTGSPMVPTSLFGTSNEVIANNLFVQQAVAPKADMATVSASLLLKADLNSPNFTGVPTAPTAPPGNFDSRLATTSFVQQAVAPKADMATVNAALALKADLNSPALIGVPTASTAPTNNSTIQIANTAYVMATIASNIAGKANTADVNNSLALKADTATLNASLLLKANTADVNNSLALKADTTALALKADTTSLALKADLNNPALVNGTTNGLSIGYRDIPVINFGGNFVLGPEHAGRMIKNSAAGVTITVPSDSVNAVPVGTTIAILNEANANLALARSDGVTVLRKVGSLVNADFTLAAGGLATFIKTSANTWYVSGGGLS